MSDKQMSNKFIKAVSDVGDVPPIHNFMEWSSHLFKFADFKMGLGTAILYIIGDPAWDRTEDMQRKAFRKAFPEVNLTILDNLWHGDMDFVRQHTKNGTVFQHYYACYGYPSDKLNEHNDLLFRIPYVETVEGFDTLPDTWEGESGPFETWDEAWGAALKIAYRELEAVWTQKHFTT